MFTDYRDQAIELADAGLVDARDLLLMALNYMSQDDVADMLDANELSSRFSEDEDEDEDQQDPMDDFNYVGSRHHY
jgi:hypothetical protein